MKPSEIFGIIIRTMGVCLWILAFWYLLYGVVEFGGWIPEDRPGDTLAMFISGLATGFIGLVMLRGATWFVRFSYPQQTPLPEEQTQAPKS